VTRDFFARVSAADGSQIDVESEVDEGKKCGGIEQCEPSAYFIFKFIPFLLTSHVPSACGGP